MKKGYKRLLIFELILLILFILNSFVWNILTGYKLILFLFVITFLFKYLFGYEKDKHRYLKDIIIEVFIFLLTFFILYYLLGLVIGFYKIDNYYNLYGIKTFIIPTILLVMIKEFLRYNILKKSEESKILTITSVVLFILIDLSSIIYSASFDSSYNIFRFIALNLLPLVSSNIMCTYISLKMGYKPGIIYLLVINLYKFIIPIVPNPNEYLSSIINFLLPIILWYRIYLFFEKGKDEPLNREYKKRNKITLILLTTFVIIIVYFTSGYFRYYAIAIASGSMTPNIYKGDVVVVEQIQDNYDYNLLRKGQVIAYKYEGVTVVHRIDKIIKEKDEYFIYTKGDANNSIDNYVVKTDMIIGIVKFEMPFIGFPTVWLNEL